MSGLRAALTALAPDLDRALAAGLHEIYESGQWSTFQLDASLEDLLKLSRRADACYDRPSTGWAYAAWYHGRRTQDSLRLLAPAIVGRTGSVTIVDLGAGTGATLWALAALRVAASKTGVELPDM